MNKSIIMKASILKKGRSGPSGLDADGCRRILTCAFGTAPVDLRKTFAQLINKLFVEELESKSSMESFVACRLIPLDKKPGLRPEDTQCWTGGKSQSCCARYKRYFFEENTEAVLY